MVDKSLTMEELSNSDKIPLNLTEENLSKIPSKAESPVHEVIETNEVIESYDEKVTKRTLFSFSLKNY